ncbi:MAG: metallophosphoesterase family protein [Actinomycetota bacterium]|nr:metallophosphoesterase family protein [Actinomycetota bacterium]
MRYGIIADIHGNLAAFKEVIKHLRGVDQIWCLGDVVGYGPDPNECIELLASFSHLCIAGNHDLGAIGKIDLDDFSLDARIACEWTGRELTLQSLNYLQNLPLELNPIDDVTLVHGSPRNPIWEYIISTWDAEANFHHFTSKVAFVGHTHIPIVFQKFPKDTRLPAGPPTGRAGQVCQAIGLEEGKVFTLREGFRYIINVGSVGQPRDGNPKASFIIFDSEKFSFEYHRVSYPIEETQEKMESNKLPAFLIYRLTHGI